MILCCGPLYSTISYDRRVSVYKFKWYELQLTVHTSFIARYYGHLIGLALSQSPAPSDNVMSLANTGYTLIQSHRQASMHHSSVDVGAPLEMVTLTICMQMIRCLISPIPEKTIYTFVFCFKFFCCPLHNHSGPHQTQNQMHVHSVISRDKL